MTVTELAWKSATDMKITGYFVLNFFNTATDAQQKTA
jgi:hypothetical protein